MSLRKGLSRSIGAAQQIRKSQAGQTRVLTLDNPAGWTIGEDYGMSTERAMKISAVNRCIELRSSTMAVLPTYIMNERTKERLSDHRLGTVLWGRANEAMTTFDYEKLMQVNRDMRGNAYSWIYRSASTGYPLELLPLSPDYTHTYFDELGRLWYIYSNPKTGELTKIHPADVLHYKAFSLDGISGISVLGRAAQTLATAESAQRYEKAMYDNGGRPAGVLTADTDLGGDKTTRDANGELITISKKDYLRREWDRIHSGPGNSFRIAILDNGLSYKPIAMNNSESQFVESQDVRVIDICRFFGVPPHLAFAGKQSYESNEQNSLEFIKYTLQADVTQREQEDSQKLLLPSDRARHLRIRKEMKALLRGDTAAQAAWYTAMRNIGVYSADDILANEDLPGVPGGDGRYASLNYVPQELWAELSKLRAQKDTAGKKMEE